MKSTHNIYYSQFKIKFLERLSEVPDIRKEQTGRLWKAYFKDFDEERCGIFIGVDFVMDIDGQSIKDIDNAHLALLVILEILDHFKAPYQVRFSGSKGFHIIIEDKYLTGTPKNKHHLKLYLNKALRDILDTQYIDPAGTNKYNQILKCPYSLDCVSGLVCLPLSRQQVQDFDIEMCSVDNVLKEGVVNRGLLERFPELQLSEKIKNVDNFIKWVREEHGKIKREGSKVKDTKRQSK